MKNLLNETQDLKKAKKFDPLKTLTIDSAEFEEKIKAIRLN